MEEDLYVEQRMKLVVNYEFGGSQWPVSRFLTADPLITALQTYRRGITIMLPFQNRLERVLL